MDNHYDIVIIGGGSAGLFAASVANTLGANTCLIERDKLGGDCTWYGCIPSKSLIRAAEAAHTISHMDKFGLSLSGKASFKTSEVMAHVRSVVQDIAQNEEPKDFEKRGIKVILGTPSFTGSKSLRVNDQTISAERFIICTGSRPLIPPIKGLNTINYLTNETLFDLKGLPESLLVLGGGPIGIELAQSLQRLGVKVTVVEMMDTILSKEDQDMAKMLSRRLEAEGVTLMTGHKAVQFAKTDTGVSATLEDKDHNTRTINAASVLVAVGRVPNVNGLNLEKTDVRHDKKGIKVNAHLQTKNPSIFACGDVVGPYPFSHVAAYQASICARNALFRKIAWSKADYSNITWATFTEPELAHLGLTEQEARARYDRVKVYTSGYTASDRAKTDLAQDGCVKIITDQKHNILGAHICGRQAGEIMQGLLVAKSRKIPLDKLGQILYIYPTLSEVIKKTAAQSLTEKMDNPLIKFLLKILRGV